MQNIFFVAQAQIVHGLLKMQKIFSSFSNRMKLKLFCRKLKEIKNFCNRNILIMVKKRKPFLFACMQLYNRKLARALYHLLRLRTLLHRAVKTHYAYFKAEQVASRKASAIMMIKLKLIMMHSKWPCILFNCKFNSVFFRRRRHHQKRTLFCILSSTIRNLIAEKRNAVLFSLSFCCLFETSFRRQNIIYTKSMWCWWWCMIWV